MGLLSIFKDTSLIGLDIGSHTIKACVSKKSGSTYQITHFNKNLLLPNSPDQVDLSQEEQEKALISNSVFETVHPLGFKKNQLCLGGAGASVIIKKVSFNKGPKDKVLKECISNLESYIHYSPEDVHMNFIKLEQLSKLDKTQDHYLVVVVAKEHIYDISQTVFDLGYEFSVMDVESFALANCFNANYGALDHQVALLNIGSNVTNVVVLEKGEVIYAQDIAVGGDKYTAEIASALKVSQKEAEGLKISFCKDGQGPKLIKDVIDRTNKLFFSEVKGNINFFQNENSNSHLSKIYITGGASNTTGLLETLSEILTCEKMNPFLKVKLASKFTKEEKEDMKSSCAISLGLSLRSL